MIRCEMACPFPTSRGVARSGRVQGHTRLKATARPRYEAPSTRIRIAGDPGVIPSQAWRASANSEGTQRGSAGRNAARSRPAAAKMGPQSMAGAGPEPGSGSFCGGTASSFQSRPSAVRTTCTMPGRTGAGSVSPTRPRMFAGVRTKGL
jgi:hypothetical protein